MPSEVKQATHYCRFPTPEDTRWSDITITFFTRDIISVKCGNKIAIKYDRLHIPCMFSDSTVEKRPTKRWYLLMAFALWGPVLNRDHLRVVFCHNDWESMRAQKHGLSKSLKYFFGLETDPIEFNKMTNEYKPLLRVRQDVNCNLRTWIYERHNG